MATDSGAENAKVTLFWLDRSRAQRIVWLLEECKGLDYKIQVFKRGQDMLAPPELKEIHPLGKSPVISVESANTPNPVILAESGTISEYITDYFAPHLVPKRYKEGMEGKVGGETEQWNRYRFYMHYAEGSLMSILLVALFMDMLKDGPQIPFFIKPITRAIAGRVEGMYLNENYRRHFGLLESQLESSPDGGKYLCGKDLTAADILMSFPLTLARAKMDEKKYPRLIAYIEMLEKEAGYVSSVKKIEEVTGEKFTYSIR